MADAKSLVFLLGIRAELKKDVPKEVAVRVTLTRMVESSLFNSVTEAKLWLLELDNESCQALFS